MASAAVAGAAVVAGAQAVEGFAHAAKQGAGKQTPGNLFGDLLAQLDEEAQSLAAATAPQTPAQPLISTLFQQTPTRTGNDAQNLNAPLKDGSSVTQVATSAQQPSSSGQPSLGATAARSYLSQATQVQIPSSGAASASISIPASTAGSLPSAQRRASWLASAAQQTRQGAGSQTATAAAQAVLSSTSMKSSGNRGTRTIGTPNSRAAQTVSGSTTLASNTNPRASGPALAQGQPVAVANTPPQPTASIAFGPQASNAAAETPLVAGYAIPPISDSVTNAVTANTPDARTVRPWPAQKSQQDSTVPVRAQSRQTSGSSAASQDGAQSAPANSTTTQPSQPIVAAVLEAIPGIGGSANAPANAATPSVAAAIDQAANASPVPNISAVSQSPGVQFAQVAGVAQHHATAPAATEAQALPLGPGFGSSGNGPASGQNGGSQANNQGPNDNTQASTAPVSANGVSPQAAQQPLHNLAAAPQGAPQAAPLAAALPNAASSAMAANIPAASQLPAQPVATELQVGPANPNANQLALPDVQALAVNIASQSQAGARQFDIRLDPPELGRVDVRLTVDSSGKAQAHLAVDKPQTLELLQRDSGTLARALKDSGVQLNNNGLQFSLKGQGRQNGSGQQPQSRGRALSVSAVASTSASSPSSSFMTSSIGVDIRV